MKLDKVYCGRCCKVVIPGAHCMCGPCRKEWYEDMQRRLRAPLGGQYTRTEEVVSAVLHVFFVAILETEEMLQRLRKDPEETHARAASSKVFTTSRVPHPIDGTAARVSGLEKQ